MGVLKKHILIFLLLKGLALSAQQPRELQGRVYSKDNDVAGTHVMNITRQRATTTDANGFFTIPVRLNDTLVFSAVQFRRKEIPVTLAVLESKLLYVPLEDALTELDEVIVMPYNLSGDLMKDVENNKIGEVVSASSLGLPNAHIKVKTQNERMLFEADNGKFLMIEFDSLLFVPMVMINLNKILNRITGRTQQIKRFIVEDEKIALLEQVRGYYPDSVYVQEFKIPENKLDEFMYFCEADSLFNAVIATNDKLKVWEFMQKKSFVYRENNDLD